ncbi:MAG: hypothetical protein CK425_01730 [Parachlamydia sp.]|nr:MAG: hypothetical protein CK425_01730 [Parachlamydia sp.]
MHSSSPIDSKATNSFSNSNQSILNESSNKISKMGELVSSLNVHETLSSFSSRCAAENIAIKYELHPDDGDIVGITKEKIGQGTQKVARLAFSVRTKSLSARLSGPKNEAYSEEKAAVKIAKFEKELDIQSLFDKEEVFLQVFSYAFYVSKAGHSKVSINTEYCEQGTLSAFCAKGLPQMSLSEVDLFTQYLHDILLALVIMKQRKVFHRDLKLDNILLKNNRAKIADFGLSSTEDQELALFKKKIFGLTGTPNKISPEFLYGRIVIKDLSKPYIGLTGDFPAHLTKAQATKLALAPKGDLWSVGALLFEAFYGKYFFEQNNFKQLSAKIINITQEEINHRCKQVEFEGTLAKFQQLMCQFLTKDPEARPSAKKAYLNFCDLFGIEPKMPRPLNL